MADNTAIVKYAYVQSYVNHLHASRTGSSIFHSKDTETMLRTMLVTKGKKSQVFILLWQQDEDKWYVLQHRKNKKLRKDNKS